MQDLHSIGNGGRGGGGGGGGRLFGGVGGSNGGDRRLRLHNHHHHHTPQAMKCPRCESLNTKFCYYNNYNLSQPRHFCKSCRRYWTKGGVLRNVPVGGGCRKTKQSKSKTNSHNNSSSHSGVRKSSNSQNSSSDSSTLTEKTMNTTTSRTTSFTTNPVFNYHETTTITTGLVNIPNSTNSVTQNPSFDPPFSSLITSSSAFNNILPIRSENQTEWLETEQQAIGEELGGFTEDWNNGTDQTLFDLTGTVDQLYWNQAYDHDHAEVLNRIEYNNNDTQSRR